MQLCIFFFSSEFTDSSVWVFFFFPSLNKLNQNVFGFFVCLFFWVFVCLFVLPFPLTTYCKGKKKKKTQRRQEEKEINVTSETIVLGSRIWVGHGRWRWGRKTWQRGQVKAVVQVNQALEPQVDWLKGEATFSGSNNCFFLMYTCPPRSSDYSRKSEGRAGKIWLSAVFPLNTKYQSFLLLCHLKTF